MGGIDPNAPSDNALSLPSAEKLRERVFQELRNADLVAMTGKSVRYLVEAAFKLPKDGLKHQKKHISSLIDEYIELYASAEGEAGEAGTAEVEVKDSAQGELQVSEFKEAGENELDDIAQSMHIDDGVTAPLALDDAVVERVPGEKLKELIYAYLTINDLDSLTPKELRFAIEKQLGLPKDGLKPQKKEISALINMYLHEQQGMVIEEKESKVDEVAEDLERLVMSVSPEELKEMTLSHLANCDPDNFSMKKLRKQLEKELGLPPKSLKSRKDEIKAIASEFTSELMARNKAAQEKKKRLIKRRSKPADDGLLGLGSYAQNYEVLIKNGRRYSVMLNQTDVNYGIRGHNKYYAIQLLKHRERMKFRVIYKWGRVGSSGQVSEDVFDSESTAVLRFEKKFKDKTANYWGTNRFVPRQGKYMLLDMAEDEPEDELDMDMEEDEGEQEQEHPTELVEDVYNLVKMICSKQLHNDTLRNLNIDTRRIPLGKLSKSQIKSGYRALQKIAEAINRGAEEVTLGTYTSQFYTVIPHDFGMRLPPIIDTPKKLAKKIRLLETLSEMEIANRIMKGRSVRRNIVDHHYAALHCELTPVVIEEEIYIKISEAIRGTHAPTHNTYTLSVENIYEVRRVGEEAHFASFSHLPNRRLLWHGTRITNMLGILSQGLRIAPPEAPKTGYMFGKGIYFADIASKSANYIHATPEQPYGLLVLVDVALGHMQPQTKHHYFYRAPEPCHSVWGQGKTIPDRENVEVIDGSEFFMGPCIRTDKESALLYNEFVVYDQGQCRIMYLVKVKFNFL